MVVFGEQLVSWSVVYNTFKKLQTK